jgi:hypothetical protein
MRELVLDIVSGRVITSAQVPDVTCRLVFLPAAMGAFSPPRELREALLGSSEPPESLEGEPPKPSHPGYCEEPELPSKPELQEVSPQIVSDVEWGDVGPETLKVERAKVEEFNSKAVGEWELERETWEASLKEYKKACDQVDSEHNKDVAAWRKSLDAHAEKVAERKRLHDDWVALHDETFSEWMADLGVLWGHRKDSFARSINGFPMFYEVGALHKEDWDRVRGAVERERERAKTLDV